MSHHIAYDHQCPDCQAWYVPYDVTVPCPQCGLVEKERFDFVRYAAGLLRTNLRKYHSYSPPAWYVGSYSDHLASLLFMIFEAHRVANPPCSFEEMAREIVNRLEWRDQEYGKDYLYQLALRVHAELEKRMEEDAAEPAVSWWRRLLGRFGRSRR